MEKNLQSELTELTPEEIVEVNGAKDVATVSASEYPEIENDPP